MRTMSDIGRGVKVLGAAAVFLAAAGMGAAVAAGGQSDAPNPPTPYPTNAKGDTYGKLPFDGQVTETPDLVAVVGVNGVEGYVAASEFGLDTAPSSPEKALQEQAKSVDREVPVYAEDGTTVIDTFVIEGASEPLPGGAD